MQKDTKREILLVSGILGICFIAFILLGRGFSYLLTLLYAHKILTYDVNTSCIMQIAYTLVVILLPFFVGGHFIGKVQKRKNYLELNAPVSGNQFGMALAIGFMALIVCNFLTSWLDLAFQNVGVTFDSSSSVTPTTAWGYVLLVLSEAVVPALCEEYAFRGVMMQSLRKYGDSAAIGISALVFGIMHGNMTQAPFAFLLGLVIGRLVISTKSLWTGIGIHLINNSYAIILTAVYDHCSSVTFAAVSIIVDVVGIAVGLVAFIWYKYYFKGFSKDKLYRPGGPNPAGVRTYRRQVELYTLISIPMLASMVYLLVELFSTIHYGG